MPRPISISDAEWDVMRVLWEAPGPITASDVVDALKQNPRTTKTYLKDDTRDLYSNSSTL